MTALLLLLAGLLWVALVCMTAYMCGYTQRSLEESRARLAAVRQHPPFGTEKMTGWLEAWNGMSAQEKRIPEAKPWHVFRFGPFAERDSATPENHSLTS